MFMTLFLLILAAIVIYYLFIYKDSNKYTIFTRIGRRCPNCNNPVEESFNVCPVCKETLKKKCLTCGEKVDAAWRYCPYCEQTIGKSEAK